ncbi:MAG TPA: hypothetical protein VGO11_09315 [Chthoniobacteraceae bacterium]|jgi:hypothetical protein|nr:hypothetical protein [Chthoniobacteraceae bacterium]
MKLPLPLLSLTALICASLHAPGAIAGKPSRDLKDPIKGDLALKSVGQLAFGADGLLLIAEPGAAAIIAVDTGDTGPVAKLKESVPNLGELLAAALRTTPDQIQIVDMAPNPVSGKVYLSVRNLAAKDVAILSVDAAGAATVLNFAERPHVRVELPKSEAGPIKNISDLAVTDDRVLITGQSNEEFSSKIFSIPLPLSAQSQGTIYSAETYHVSHGKWETKAPIQSFIPYDDKGTPCVIGAFACTPIAKFPIANLSSGANVRGTSVVELGSGNRPIDLFSYTKNGKSWVVTNTMRFKQPFFGPSKYWGVRVSTEYLTRTAPEEINEKAARRDVKEKAGPDGIEIMESLSGAVHIGKLDDTTMMVLRENGDKLQLESVALP